MMQLNAHVNVEHLAPYVNNALLGGNDETNFDTIKLNNYD